jgi:hypothetical protein
MSTWCVRLEDLMHLWITSDGSRILKRVKLSDNLEAQSAKILSMASTLNPIQVDIEVMEWSGAAFRGRLRGIEYPPPRRYVRKPRTYAPMRLGPEVSDAPTGASADEGAAIAEGP